MKFLLDVNVLLAIGLRQHALHNRAIAWAHSSVLGDSELATCSITELGFLRIVPQVKPYGVSFTHARDLLLNLKRSPALKLTFIADSVDGSQLPTWVTTAKQTTDGHLWQLAETNGFLLATLDGHIPGAFMIPAN